MVRSVKALKNNTINLLEKGNQKLKTALYYGFIPALLYLGFTTDPKPDIKALLGVFFE